MRSEHITLKIGSLASLMIDTRQGETAPGIRIGNLNADEISNTDGVIIEDENSPLIIQVRWKHAGSAHDSLQAVASAENAGRLGRADSSASMVSTPTSDDRLMQIITTEYRRIKERSITDGRIQSCSQHLQELSAKEIDVLILMIEGRSCKEIATQLRIGLATVAKHRVRILKKLEVRDTVELVQILLAVFDDVQLLSNLSH